MEVNNTNTTLDSLKRKRISLIFRQKWKKLQIVLVCEQIKVNKFSPKRQWTWLERAIDQSEIFILWLNMSVLDRKET